MAPGNKFRIYPTAEQQKILLNWIGCQRFIYNAKVGEDRYFRRFLKKSLSLCGQKNPIDQKYAQFISEDTSFLRDVPSQILRNGSYRWRSAYQRFFSKAVAGRPKIKKKHGRQSVMLTSELFSFALEGDKVRLNIGTKKFPVGGIEVNNHNTVEDIPAAIYIGVEAGHWYLSFALNAESPAMSDAEIAEDLISIGKKELLKVSEGFDLGVNIPLASSSGKTFGLSDIQQKRIKGEERHKKRWQRKQARRKDGSKRQAKAKQKVARYQRYGANVRHDFAHKTSREMVDSPDVKLFIYEDLKIKNMSASAKGTVEKPGKKVKQKTGLNRAILGSAWGKLKLFTSYKARQEGKLVIVVPAHQTSQECSECGFIHKDNRLNQAEFVCLSCGYKENADTNAAKVVKERGVKTLLAGEITCKKPLKSGSRKQLGSGRPAVTPDGEAVSRTGREARAQSSLIRQTRHYSRSGLVAGMFI
jgi:putative transposase